MAFPSSVRDGMNSLAHLFEGSATADVGDGVVDVLVGRLRIFLEKSRDCHDHPALAVAALWNVVVDPGLLHLVQGAVGCQSFDRGDLSADGVADKHAAGARCNAVDVNGAGAALCNAASVFGAGKSNVFPDCPKQRRVRVDVDIDSFAVDREVCHRVPLDVFDPSVELRGNDWTES